MSYKARLKIVCKDNTKIKTLTYSFVNETKGESTHNDFKFDSNNCTKVFDCEKNDLVKFYIYQKDKKLHMRVKVKPALNGIYNDSVYTYPSSIIKDKKPGNIRNSKGNAIFIPYKSLQDYVDTKKSQGKIEQTKDNRKEKIEKSIETVSAASSAVGVMLTGAKVYENKSFHWGVLHSNGPQLTIQRMREMLNFRMYDNDNIPNIRVARIQPIVDRLDRINGHVGKVGDAKSVMDIYGFAKEKDIKNLSSKAGEFAGGKAGEAVGVSLAGVCTRAAIREVANPRNALIIGGTCAMAYHYVGSELGSMAGKTVGETEGAMAFTVGTLEALIKIDQREQEAHEKYMKEEIKKDPGLEGHPFLSD